MKKLPDAEFDVMKEVWSSTLPVTAGSILRRIGNEKGWKVPTVSTLLMRLVERGFLRTEKEGKERSFYPLISKEEYLRFETADFLKRYHDNSYANLFSALFQGGKLTQKEIEELSRWVEGCKDDP